MRTENINLFKGTVTAVFSLVSSMLGALAIPVLLLVGCNVIDYVTGLLAAKYRSQKIDSYKGLRGIVKKVCMWLLVIVGAMLDELIFYAVQAVGTRQPFSFLIACVVAIWLVCNEIISILENIDDTRLVYPE